MGNKTTTKWKRLALSALTASMLVSMLPPFLAAAGDESASVMKERLTRTFPESSLAPVTPAGASAVRGVGEELSARTSAGAELAPIIDLSTIKEIKVTPETLVMIVGQAEAITVTAVMKDGSEQDVTENAWFSSLYPSVFSVNEKGIVVAVSKGSMDLWVSYGPFKKTIKVTVNAAGSGVIVRPGETESAVPADPTPTRPVFNPKVDQAAVKAVLARAQNAPSVSFTDVAATSWSAPIIDRAVRMDIVNGYADGTFRPNAEIMRAEFALLLARALGLKINLEVPVVVPAQFADTEGHWANTHLAALNELGVLSGYADGTFRPRQKITRAELVVMLARLTNYVPPAANAFSDVTPGWSSKAIGAFAAAGIVNGTGEGQFSPEASATRAEAVAIVVRMLDKLMAPQQ